MTNEQYHFLLEPYQNASQMMLTRLEVLNHNLYAKDTVCPIHTMQHRIVVGVPVYYRDTMEYFPVEIQLRTMAMDFWASMEHRICYKKNPADGPALREEFARYAGLLEGIEEEFEHYNEEKKQGVRHPFGYG